MVRQCLQGTCKSVVSNPGNSGANPPCIPFISRLAVDPDRVSSAQLVAHERIARQPVLSIPQGGLPKADCCMRSANNARRQAGGVPGCASYPGYLTLDALPLYYEPRKGAEPEDLSQTLKRHFSATPRLERWGVLVCTRTEPAFPRNTIMNRIPQYFPASHSHSTWTMVMNCMKNKDPEPGGEGP